MKIQRLEPAEVAAALEQLPRWRIAEDDTAISRDFKFTDFREAFTFMSECALTAEKMDHHPEWTNVYNRVGVSLSTHSAGGITELDLEMAKSMDKAAQRFGL